MGQMATGGGGVLTVCSAELSVTHSYSMLQ